MPEMKTEKVYADFSVDRNVGIVAKVQAWWDRNFEKASVVSITITYNSAIQKWVADIKYEIRS